MDGFGGWMDGWVWWMASTDPLLLRPDLSFLGPRRKKEEEAQRAKDERTAASIKRTVGLSEALVKAMKERGACVLCAWCITCMHMCLCIEIAGLCVDRTTDGSIDWLTGLTGLTGGRIPSTVCQQLH